MRCSFVSSRLFLLQSHDGKSLLDFNFVYFIAMNQQIKKHKYILILFFLFLFDCSRRQLRGPLQRDRADHRGHLHLQRPPLAPHGRRGLNLHPQDRAPQCRRGCSRPVRAGVEAGVPRDRPGPAPHLLPGHDDRQPGHPDVQSSPVHVGSHHPRHDVARRLQDGRATAEGG